MSSAGLWLELGRAPESFLERRSSEGRGKWRRRWRRLETQEENDRQEEKLSEVVVARPPNLKMRQLSSVLLEEPLTSLERRLGRRIHLTKRPIWSSASTTFVVFLFLKRSGHCTWTGVGANRSLPQVVSTTYWSVTGAIRAIAWSS